MAGSGITAQLQPIATGTVSRAGVAAASGLIRGALGAAVTSAVDQAEVLDVVDQSAARWVAFGDLKVWDKNPRRNDPAVPRVAASIQRFGFVAPIVVWTAGGRMVAGHTRLKAMAMLCAADQSFTAKGAPGPGLVRVVFHDFANEAEADLYALADNRLQELATWDDDAVADILAHYDAEAKEIAGWGVDDLPSPPRDEDTGTSGALQARFGVPPFTILDARQGYWRERKRAWLALGIRSEEGREGCAPGGGKWLDDHMVDGKFVHRDLHAGVAPSKGLGVTVNASEGKYEYMSGRGASGGSIFDPVLVELLVRWFAPPGGTVLDPFAGGSVRGIVCAALGRRYVGIELRSDQVTANANQWDIIGPTLQPVAQNTPAASAPVEDNDTPLSPVQQHGNVWLKRDDLFAIAGVRGGKVRSCWALAQQAVDAGAVGIVTAGSRSSPQVNIVAHIAKRLGLRCRVHTPTGDPSPEVQAAVDMGAELIQHKAGYNNVIIARAREDAAALGWPEIPFGMEHPGAVTATMTQVANIPPACTRLVVPVGSGMSLCGILHGLDAAGRKLPVLGVVVGSDPKKRLAKYAPKGWENMVTLVQAGVDYHVEVAADVGGVVLDPVYEAKCVAHMQPGDCLWVVGIRQTAATPAAVAPGKGGTVLAPHWVQGDSNQVLDYPELQLVDADFVFTCPPYADLEVYSDDPADISNMPYPQFLAMYRSIIAKACGRLKQDRFAAIVVGDVRAPDGTYRNLVSHTIQAFEDAGCRLYNEAILVTSLGSIPIRAGKTFQAGRKLGKTHQNVLVFVKGDGRAATVAVGDVDFGSDDVATEED